MSYETALRRSKSLRDRLQKEFKPTFDEYASEGGIPLSELKNLLKESDITTEKLNKFVERADRNDDSKITYEEFLNQVLEEEDILERLKIRSRMLNRAVVAIAPMEARQRQRKLLAQKGYDIQDTYNWGEAYVDNYVEAYDCLPPPIFIPLVTILEIGVFIYYGIVHYQDHDPTNDVTASSGVPLSSPLIYNPHKRHQAWRFLTYMFLHNGYLHLAFNCLSQMLLGTLLELVHKFWRVGLVYLLGVIAGSLAHSVSDPYVLLVGASGGCYALFGAHIATVITNWRLMQENWLDNPINFLSSAVCRLLFILLLAGGDTGLAIYSRLTNPNERTTVGFAAHMGGFVAGLFVGIPILRNLEVETWEKYCFWICLILYTTFTVVAILFNGYCIQIQKCPPTIF